MKYFTRDLYRRCRSTDDDILDAATAEWERANEQYEQHIRALEATLPHLREFTSLLLHDARLQSIGWQGNRLLITWHKDIPPRDLVTLEYDLVSDPVIEPFADHPKEWSRPTHFEFDEFDLQSGDPPVYEQAIVFGNGWLMRLRFGDVRVSVAMSLFPAASEVLMPSAAAG